MHREQIKELALANGFKLKQQPDGSEDLNPYVYEFAQSLVDTLLPKAPPGKFDPPRMCDFFELPVEKWQFSKLLRDQSGETIDQSTEQIVAAAYAINNHDSIRAANLELARQLEAFGEEVEQLRKDKKRNAARDAIEKVKAERRAIEQERDQLKAAIHGAVDDFIERVSAAKQTIKCEDGAGLFVSVGAINNGISHIRKSINEPTDCIAAHDAEVIERETQRCIEAVETEPEYPDEAPPELMKYINQCIENKDADHMLHMMRHSVRLTKSEIIKRIRGLPTQQAKVQPVNDSCQMECGAYGTYCRCRAEKAEEVQS